MRLTLMEENSVWIHDCLGRDSSGTFLMTPSRVRSQVQPLAPQGHVLPAILAAEGSPRTPPVLRQLVRVGTSQDTKPKYQKLLPCPRPRLTFFLGFFSLV